MEYSETLKAYFRCATDLALAEKHGAEQRSRFYGRTLLELHENLILIEQQLVEPPGIEYDRVLRVAHRIVSPLEAYRKAKARRNTLLITDRLQNKYVINSVFDRELCLHEEATLYVALEHMLKDEDALEAVRGRLTDLPSHILLDVHLHLHDIVPFREIVGTFHAQRLLTETLAKNYAVA